MRKTIVTTAAAGLLCVGALGCKTAPKLAFWKSADTTDVESTALAHSAPALPADVAKEAEGLASTTPSIGSTAPASPFASQAPPYTPATAASPVVGASATAALAQSGSQAAPSPYPVTSAPAYSRSPTAASTPSTTIAATTSPAMPVDESADLGAIDMPYNPNAVPPVRNVAAATPTSTTPSSTGDRYGASSYASSPSSYTPGNIPGIPAAPAASGDRYGNVASTPAMPSGNTDFVATTAPAAIGATSPPITTAEPYATGSTVAAAASLPMAPAPTTSAPATSAPATTAVATIPFRPRRNWNISRQRR